MNSSNPTVKNEAVYAQIIEDIFVERLVQDFKFGAQHTHSDEHWLTILAEEFGEVAREVYENKEDTTSLQSELVQVAAVAVAWLEALEQRSKV